MKSMQPVPLEVDMAKSAALLKRKRRRQELDDIRSKLLSPRTPTIGFSKVILNISNHIALLAILRREQAVHC